jgi:hypothetical protein
MRRLAANIAFLILIMAVSGKIYSQNSLLHLAIPKLEKTYRNTEMLIGFSWQGNVKDKVKMMRYVEAGIAKSLHAGTRHGPASFGVFMAEELYFGSETTVFGTKLGAYSHWLIDLGLSIIYYTDFKKGNFKVRPEAGIGIRGLRLVFGYNIPTIDNRAFELLRINNAQLSIQFLLPVRKKEIKREGAGIFRQLFKKL